MHILINQYYEVYGEKVQERGSITKVMSDFSEFLRSEREEMSLLYIPNTA